jgi:hypothetical protein
MGLIGRVIAAFLGLLGVMICIPGIFLLWIAGTIALKLEE